MKPIVILAVPYMYGLDKCIEKNLNHHGYDVINLCYDDRDSHYPHFGSRLLGLYHKTVTKNSNYKKRLKFIRYQAEINKKLAALGGRKADYALCIRANVYPKEIIAQIRRHSEVCVNYQWDGVDKFPDIFDYLPYFDRFFVFSPEDAAKYAQYGFQTASNFYFDYPIEAGHKGRSGLYFLGGYETNREAETRRFIKEARRRNLPLDFYVYCKDGRAEKTFGTEGITYLNRSNVLSFMQNLEKVRGCSAVVDFVQYEDYGLSFRVFDALRYDKKLITTNGLIKKYDFYCPENIFVWDGKNLEGLAEFMDLPYRPIEAEIKQKYSFKGFLDKVFEQ
ncbi:MAG: hypothetical protein Q4C79_07630 [Neisseria sp.]|uniref:hypothetical protein n=1 Tax=Neisseria sp. TaxID=192066 RepID=UPI0026DD45E2|nr:hypothetical protein [Neisseria sp.]MDO4248812.1 hypothetical protein [Neisseria sp.]